MMILKKCMRTSTNYQCWDETVKATAAGSSSELETVEDEVEKDTDNLT